eukprot:gene41810-51821_t
MRSPSCASCPSSSQGRRSAPSCENRHRYSLPSAATRARTHSPQKGCDMLAMNPRLPEPSAWRQISAVPWPRAAFVVPVAVGGLRTRRDNRR